MTLLLVIINCAVFWGPQRDDDAALNEAVAYYFESDLGAIEIPLYEQFLQDRKPAYHSILHSDPELRPMIPPAAILLEIYSHEDFITDLPDVLRNSLDPPQLEIWWRHHDQVKKILSRVTWFNYGMRPAYTGPTEMLTHMFLHGGIGHLLGNMLFLMLVGYVVEMILGKTIYLFSYLAAGVVAGGFDLVFNSGSIVTGIGASGAISGVMGMYVVLFGLRKINFFYHVLFYFNYIKLPAIVVLPVWIGYELLKMVIYPDSNVNYLAHAGGLIGGAILGFVGKSKIGCADSAVLDSQKTADDQKQQHHAISQLLSNMEYEKAALLILRQESWHRFPNMLSQLTAASNNINNKLVAQKVFLAVANLRTKDK
ncbi:MAG: rhomboid family intramembrane serine protease, partial [Gammaproteobacteria bacterium]|nr:rhomboid family intramembrane serine protease [Gammaproteobacteria bacterium]